MYNFKCCLCHSQIEESEAKMWHHIQYRHPEKYEAMRHLSTTEMVDECYQPQDAMYEKKTLLVTPAFVHEMIADLSRVGLITENGDRKSRYFPVAMGRKEKSDRRVEMALIEESSGIPQDEAGYAFHVINDVDGTDCQMFTTDHLDTSEPLALFDSILKKLVEGRL